MGQSIPLISVTELARLPASAVLPVDCRFSLKAPHRGREEYRTGHLPGAVYAHLDEDLSDLGKSGLGRHPLPEAAAFAAVLGRWGWRPDLTVVAYDAGGGAMTAARLWWLLRWMGARVRVLDGGLAAWQAAGQALEKHPAKRPATRPEVHFDARQVVYTEPLRALLAEDRVLLVDARAAERFAGRVEPIDPVAGHIPGARNRPFAGNLEQNGRWRERTALRADWETLLAGRPPQDVVHMCGSGVTACHNLLSMEYVGLTGSRLYAPSWSGWLQHPGYTLARGPVSQAR